MWEMVQVITNRNCVYQTAYHVVWCPKYRKDVLTGQLAKLLDCLLETIAVADAVKILKGTTARRLFTRFPALRKRL